jgi:uncharacterized protein
MSVSVIDRVRSLGFDPGVLGLTILPTEKCNFRCVYCYETFPNRRMSDDVAAAIKNLITERSKDLHTLSIRWFGGEPLLESHQVIDITTFAQTVCRQNNIYFWSSITTNGYLLKFSLFERLLSAGVRRFQISLDGMETEHNATRRTNNKDGSFRTIMNNLLQMRASTFDFQIILRLHIHAANVTSICSLIDYISDRFHFDARFNVLLEKIKNYGSEHGNKLPLASDDAMRVARSRLSEGANRATAFDLSDVHCCYAALPNHFVIRANGKVQKCTVALYDERNDVGFLRSDGSFEWSADRTSAWASGLLEGDVKKIQCPWKAMNRPVSSDQLLPTAPS